MDKPTLEDFLLRAIAWPNPNEETGWVNLHWRVHERKGITGGQAFKTLPDVLGFVDWTRSRGKGKVADLYFCTSLQLNRGDAKQRSGKYYAERSADNAVSSKLLFADVDKYATKREMFLAIEAFCNASFSPFPTALVDSGGGLHAYWILPSALRKEEWIPLAHKLDGLMNEFGLKHDNISTDIARILRMPNTLNYKRANLGNPPQPVSLKLLNGDIDLQAWKSLHEASPTPRVINSRVDTSVAIEHYFENPAIIKEGPSKVFIGKIPLAEQIGEGAVETAPVVKLCPMFRETLATGGKEVQQPVWHQQALACTFFVDGRQFFHDLGRQHIGYSRESSDAMYDRKIRDRAAKGLGYPSCAAFERDGAKQCSTCTLKDRITSPLNLTIDDVNTKVDRLPLGVNTSVDTDIRIDGAPPPPPDKIRDNLPDGYTIGDDGIVCFPKKVGRHEVRVPVWGSKIIDFMHFKNRSNSLGLRVIVTGDGGDERTIDIPPSAFGGASKAAVIDKILNDGGAVTMDYPSEQAKIMTTFRARLAAETEALRVVSCGWEYEEPKEGEIQGRPIGFAYDGKVYKTGGIVREAFGGEENIQQIYFVTGSQAPWINALRAILRMQSSGLSAVVLSAFAAPLMVFSGQPSTVVMVRGQSGGSKSTASAVACAVWACPRTAIFKPSSSKLGMMRRTSKVRHLPVIWDDVRSDQFEKIKETLMEITQGGEGVKLDHNRDEREQGVWDNMLLTTSNASLLEYLEKISKNDGAALVRCFEFEVPKIVAGDSAYEDPNRLSAIISSLDANHGHVGRQYAHLLGADPAGLQTTYDDVVARLTKRIAPFQPHERFWMAAAATMLMGGMLANTLKVFVDNDVKFNLLELEEFLVKIYLELRKRYKKANVHSDTSPYVSYHMRRFINEYATDKNEIVWTLETPHKVGKPAATAPVAPIGDKLHNMKRVSVRFIISERKVRFTKSAIDHYLRKEEVSVDRFEEGAVNFYGAKILDRCRIAAGLVNISASAPEKVFEIDILPGTWLDGMLTQHSTPEEEIQKTVQPLIERTQNQRELHPQPARGALGDEKDAS